MFLCRSIAAVISLFIYFSVAVLQQERGYGSGIGASNSHTPVASVNCNGAQYTYERLAGYGFVAPNARDKYGDTIGGIGSAIAIEPRSWNRHGAKFEAVIWGLPDRGWNTQGTLNFQSRAHKFRIQFEPDASGGNGTTNLHINYFDTILLTGPDGSPTTGLDADARGVLTYPGFPDLPAAIYTGDGYGGPGQGGKRIAIDSEGLVLNGDGTFWISDEYGPYVYKFDKGGRMTQAIRPPNALIPLRNNTESFNSGNPPIYDPDRVVVPADPTSGRANNQGFEGLTVSPDGRTLSVLLQSAAIQDGGTRSRSRRYTRLLQYDLSSNSSAPEYKAEYVVPLPLFVNNENETRPAAQSEVHAVSDTQFLILARDSNAGYGLDFSESRYRHADVFDISNATNIRSQANDAFNGNIATRDGVLRSGVVPATYCSFLDYNVNAQLARFGLHNGGAQDLGLLNEKWESLALVPALGDKGERRYSDSGEEEFYLFSFSDNDFVTRDGYANFGRFQYNDNLDVNNQVLVFKVRLPASARERVH